MAGSKPPMNALNSTRIGGTQCGLFNKKKILKDAHFKIMPTFSRRRYITQNSTKCHSPSPLESNSAVDFPKVGIPASKNSGGFIDCPKCTCPTTDAPSVVEVIHHRDVVKTPPLLARICRFKELNKHQQVQEKSQRNLQIILIF